MIRIAAVLLVACGIAVQAWAGVIPTQAERYRALLIREARVVWGMDAPVATFAAQIHQESMWRADAVSRAGAQGLDYLERRLAVIDSSGRDGFQI